MILEDASTLYSLLKSTPLLYRIDRLNLETGARIDSGRVVVRKQIHDALEEWLGE